MVAKSMDPLALESVPGVGKSIAQDLRQLGINTVPDLKGQDPELLYERSNALAGLRQDRCLLYTFRCAVYYAETPEPDPALLKWWNWKET